MDGQRCVTSSWDWISGCSCALFGLGLLVLYVDEFRIWDCGVGCIIIWNISQAILRDRVGLRLCCSTISTVVNPALYVFMYVCMYACMHACTYVRIIVYLYDAFK